MSSTATASTAARTRTLSGRADTAVAATAWVGVEHPVAQADGPVAAGGSVVKDVVVEAAARDWMIAVAVVALVVAVVVSVGSEPLASSPAA